LLLRNSGVVVAFHRVDNRLSGNPIACTVDQFTSYCDFFEEYFDVVKVSDLVNRVRAGLDCGGCLAITFDDGYLDNFEIAAPELEARGLPAAFFVTSGLIGTNSQPAWDQEFGSRAEWMSWDHVRSLHERGFEIGAHTIHHVDLGKLHGPAARQEIAGSKQQLEAELKDNVQLFSYPFGSRQSITEANRLIVEQAGFSCCFSAYGGPIRGNPNLFNLPRCPITPWHISPQHFAFEIMFRR
jgi:peptidoglycan/xylan/chitin deacetylase (PgdA/CDA1 family)